MCVVIQGCQTKPSSMQVSQLASGTLASFYPHTVVSEGQLPSLLPQSDRHYSLIKECQRLCTGGVLQDNPIAKLTPKSVRAVFAPKVDAVTNLHHSSWAAPLGTFNAFSSVASFIGSAGQGNYAAANSVLDAWACSLQASGVSGTSSLFPSACDICQNAAWNAIAALLMAFLGHQMRCYFTGKGNLVSSMKDAETCFCSLFCAPLAEQGSRSNTKPLNPSHKSPDTSLVAFVWLRVASSVQWGAWASVGMAAKSPAVLARIRRSGMGAIAPAAGLAVLQAILFRTPSTSAAAVIANPFDWTRLLNKATPLPPVFTEHAPVSPAAVLGAVAAKRQPRTATTVVVQTSDALLAEIRSIVHGMLGLEVLQLSKLCTVPIDFFDASCPPCWPLEQHVSMLYIEGKALQAWSVALHPKGQQVIGLRGLCRSNRTSR